MPSPLVEPAVGSGAGAALSRPFGRTSGWQKQAACRGSDLRQFFEHRMVAGRPQAAVYRVAERFCADCPVVVACRSEADATDAVGLWGGQWRPDIGGARPGPVDLLLPTGSKSTAG